MKARNSFPRRSITSARHVWLAIVLAFTLPACSSGIPTEIRNAPERAVSISEVRQQPDASQSAAVRWGGTILNTENRDKTSWVTILAQPLNKQGRPRQTDNSQGRSIAVVDEFLEPLLYTRDRQITVIGTVQGSHTRNVGDFPYQYPLISVDFYHLWPKAIKPVEVDYPPYLWPYYPWYHAPHYPRYPYQLVPHHR